MGLNINFDVINDIIYVVILPNIKYILTCSIIIFFVSLIIFVVCSYFVLKILKKSIDEYNILFNQYNKQSQKILDNYGDNELTKVYLVRKPITKMNSFFLNVLTFYKFEKLINESRDNFPYHTLVIFELKLENNMRKFIMVEKNNYISICEKFMINDLQDMKMLKIKHNKYTLKSVLNATQKRLGNEKYFNWHIYKNNCQEFTKELLITLHKLNKTNKKYVFHDKILKILTPTDFTLHIGYSFVNLYNIFEKYIFDNFN
jgi:hypothetical protein